MPSLSRIAALLVTLTLAGCGGGGEGEKKDETSGKDDPAPKKQETVQLGKSNLPDGGGAVRLDGFGKAPMGDDPKEKKYSTEDVRRALNPLQVMVGEWRGILQRNPDFDPIAWRWDFSDRRQPALRFDAGKGLVMKNGSITYFPADESFQLVATDKDDNTRTLDGEFEVEPHKVAGDDNKLHITYKLVLREATPPEGEMAWRITLNQEDNNGMRFELERLRGESYVRFETIRGQREGTSIARSFDDYGDRTCIVSGGLGTSTVSYNGETYYVCCSGCDAAFKDDPEFWIAKALESDDD